jgi:dCMP deaminase
MDEVLERPKLEHIFMNFARDLARRGTCSQINHVGKPRRAGAVITTGDFLNVLSVGYNGNHSGGPNKCDNPEATGDARCGCIHAEMNAIAKCDNNVKNKFLFVTSIPCSLCAKLIINSGFSKVFVFLDDYSDERHDGKKYTENIDMIKSTGIKVFGQKDPNSNFFEI